MSTTPEAPYPFTYPTPTFNACDYLLCSPPPPASNSGGSSVAVTTIITLVFVVAGVAVLGVIVFLAVRAWQSRLSEPLAVAAAADVTPAVKESVFVEIKEEKLQVYSSEQIKIMTDNFTQRLGGGGFGTVYKGTLENGLPVAIKVLKGNLKQKIKKQFLAEVNSLGRTHHFNLVRLFGFCFDEDLKALVYEFMENGSLGGFLFDDHKKSMVGFDQLLNIAIGAARGIAYLHEYCHDKIIHYDIKPENVLLDGKLSAKVSDFGLARLCTKDATHNTWTGFKGTRGYAAPEMWLRLPLTEKCDVYSFGMLLFEVLGRRRNTGENPSSIQQWLPKQVWKRFEEGNMEQMVSELEIDPVHRGKAERIAVVALWCAQSQPDSRPSMCDVVKMLEGDVIVTPPPDPFPQFRTSDGSDVLNASADASSSGSVSTHWSTPYTR